MTVVRSTATERRRWTRGPRLGERPRRREGRLLAAALAVALLGLSLTYRAVRAPFRDIERDLAAGRIVNLNELREPGQLADLLTSFTDPAERSFVAGRVWRHLTRPDGGQAVNVGELGTLRVAASEVAGKTLPVLEERLGRQPAAGQDGEPSVRLLDPEQLRRLKPALVVRRPAGFRGQFRLWSALVVAAFAAVHFFWRWRRTRVDELVLPIVALLCGLGLTSMVSIWDPLRDSLYFRGFAQGVIGGCAVMALVGLVDFERPLFRRLTFPALLGAFGLSAVLILFGTGPGNSDARVNFLGFQPAEVIKILAVLFLAGYFYDRWELLRELRERRGWFARLARLVRIPKLEYLLPPLAALALLLLFFFLQRDLGPALVLSVLFVCLYGVARGRPTMAIVGLGVMIAGFAAGFRLGVPRTVARRIAMWLSPWDNGVPGGDHLAASFWSLATGGLTGTGLGLGQPGFVPAVHTDLVLAALGEELGFVGLLALLALYGLLGWRCLRIADRAGGLYSTFLALGLTLLLALQLLLIASGAFGLLPLSGVVTPFLSYGRSAMVANFAVLGCLLAISGRAAGGGGERRFRGGTRTVGLLLAAWLGAVLFRVAYLQVLRADSVLTRGNLALQADGYLRPVYNPRLVAIAELIPRGSIFDRSGIPLAINAEAPLDGEVRALLADLGAAAGPPAAAAEGRFYPFGGATFHLLGDLNTRVNWAASNTSFVERDARVQLHGYDDYARVRRVRQPDGSELALPERDYRELIPLLRYRHRPGHAAVRQILERPRDVRLTIDVRLQLRAASLLARQAGAHAGRGAAVVLDAATGELLASVSVPWPEGQPVTPAAGEDRLLDRARYGVYPPGSTFKVVTAMAALGRDPGLARRSFTCAALGDGRVGNRVRGWGRPIRDDPTVTGPHGEVDLVKGIRVSCNAYFAQLATYEVGARQLLETAAKLGISVARPNTVEQLVDALPQAGYGQGQVIATPLEMARVAAAVANGGAAPHERWVIGGGDDAANPPVQVLGPAQAALLAEAMREVVTHGSAARILNEVSPAIAGKTGTAEVEGKPSHSWFIGFAPAGEAERKVAFAVLVEHGGYGGRAAAETAGDIVEELAALGYFDRGD